MDDRQFYVYIITNYTNRVLYTGVTNNLYRRLYEHKNKTVKVLLINIIVTNLFILKQLFL